MLVPLLAALVQWSEAAARECSDLLPGQYRCRETEGAAGCSEKGEIEQECWTLPNLNCSGQKGNQSFVRAEPCWYSSGKDWRLALGLSVFFGWLGLDRFYLGYPALGLLKLSTFGGFLLFHLLDIVLIALQIVGPADGTAYQIDYYGPSVSRLLPSLSNNLHSSHPLQHRHEL